MSRHPDPTALLARGLAVFPIPAGSKRPGPGWHDAQFRDGFRLKANWRPGDNIGVGCRANGLVVLDLDVKDGCDGIVALAETCATYGHDWPYTFMVRTPSGGLHLYFRVPAGRVIGSTSKGTSGLGPGIDTRGPGRTKGGYVVGPGSVVDGRPYLFDNDWPIAVLPDWIADILDVRGEDEGGHSCDNCLGVDPDTCLVNGEKES